MAYIDVLTIYYIVNSSLLCTATENKTLTYWQNDKFSDPDFNKNESYRPDATLLNSLIQFLLVGWPYFSTAVMQNLYTEFGSKPLQLVFVDLHLRWKLNCIENNLEWDCDLKWKCVVAKDTKPYFIHYMELLYFVFENFIAINCGLSKHFCATRELLRFQALAEPDARV